MGKVIKSISLLILLIPFGIKAIGTNGSTGAITPSGSSSGATCKSGSYWAGSVAKPPLEAVRITFYDTKGKQLGNTIDLWDKTYVYNNAKCDTSTPYKKCSVSTQFIEGTPSKIDYVNGVNTQLVKGPYSYYVDTRYDAKTDSPLIYTADGREKAFKAYFTNADNIQKIMAVAGVKNINAQTSAEYNIILEPVWKVTHCTSNAQGVYSVADFAKFFPDNNFTLNCKFPRSLRLSTTVTLYGKTYTAPAARTCKDVPKTNYTKAEQYSTLGVGMFLIYGDEVCKGNCAGNYYKIVYRTLDLGNPFLGIDGKGRTLSTESNWYGKQNTIDSQVYEKKPLYTVTLTPSKIKQIRSDNVSKNINYSNILAKYNEGATFSNSQFKKDFGL